MSHNKVKKETGIFDYKEILDDVKTWVREVGRIQRDNLRKENLLVETKSTEVDLVTEIDKLSEKYFLDAIMEKYPDHSILSEEAGVYGEETSDYLWVIDPLDGTTNYAQGLPIFAISVALQYKKETVLGVVYLPMLELMFEAVRGENAYLNGKQITVSRKTELKQCLLSTGFPYDQAVHQDNNTNYVTYFVPKSRGIRRIGSAAYDLGNVAAGIMDGYWELNLSPWDVAAGMLIVEEAGGRIIQLEQKRGISIIAANEHIAQQIWKGITTVDQMKEE
ncbi:inositol monophosphatase [Dehalobacter sp. DCM]|uniref:inositol monophosphatase family protein n=1 Tax=Dehalobacter sp. DCM TaxID=2907827 RepID=UPI003082001C|nr:inositol monophosphatase [Dehalobacter sp. DCM]